LRNYGNMSSVTVMFILNQLQNPSDEIIALAFGPGLTIEGITLTCPAQQKKS
ncbi:MAG: hypothetical protein KDK65_06710, partial [Chlamydiia bacterium]|nr:hypothetical protein [Chlamydiia bacterium]